MLFEELKPILHNGERYIVVENGKPEYVILGYRDYIRLAGGTSQPSRRSSGSLSSWERANAELEVAGRDDRPEPAAETLPPPVDPTTVRLEDLPL